MRIAAQTIGYLSSRLLAAVASFGAIAIIFSSSPTSFLPYLVCVTAGAILNGMAFQGVRMAFQRYVREDNDGVNSLAWTLFFGVASAIIAIATLLSILVREHYLLIWGSVWIAISQGWFELRLERLRVNGRSTLFALASLARAALLLASIVAVGAIGPDPKSFVAAQVLAYAAGGLVWSIGDIRVRFGSIPRGDMLLRFRRFALAGSTFVSAGLLASLADRLVVAALLQSPQASAYGLASSIAQGVVASVGQAVGLVTLPMVLASLAGGKSDIEQKFRTTLHLHMMLTVPAAITLTVLGRHVITLLGGPPEAEGVLAILSAAALIQAIFLYYVAHGFQVEEAVGTMRTILVVFSLLGLACSVPVAMHLGMQWVAVANLVVQCCCSIVAIWWLRDRPFVTVKVPDLAWVAMLAVGLLAIRIFSDQTDQTTTAYSAVILTFAGLLVLIYIAAYWLQRRPFASAEQ